MSPNEVSRTGDTVVFGSCRVRSVSVGDGWQNPGAGQVLGGRVPQKGRTVRMHTRGKVGLLP